MTDEEMLQKLIDSFGTAESETVSEDSYSFKNKNNQIKEDISFIKGLERNRNRLYFKDKTGFDR